MHDRTYRSPLLSTPTQTKKWLQQYNVVPKKSLGQNFIVDPNILKQMVREANLAPEGCVLEIGPGIGALTEHLAQASARVVAVEIDQRLIPVLRETIQHDNVTIVHGDILQQNIQELYAQYFVTPQQPSPRVTVVANLPYYITTPIIMKLLEEAPWVGQIVVMVQKEVCARMTASPGTKAYGSLSLAVRYYAEASMTMTIPSTVYIPQPHVDSAVIKLVRRTAPCVTVRDEAGFFRLIRTAFAQRRKTIGNNVQVFFEDHGGKHACQAWLMQCGIDPQRRGETLTLEEFAVLANEAPFL